MARSSSKCLQYQCMYIVLTPPHLPHHGVGGDYLTPPLSNTSSSIDETDNLLLLCTQTWSQPFLRKITKYLTGKPFSFYEKLQIKKCPPLKIQRKWQNSNDKKYDIFSRFSRLKISEILNQYQIEVTTFYACKFTHIKDNVFMRDV